MSNITRLSLGQPPKKLTVPPRRTISSTQCQVSGLPTASIGDIGAAAAGQVADGFDGVGVLIGAHQFVGAHGFGAFQLRAAAANGDHAAPYKLGQPHEHQPDGPQTDDGDGIAGARMTVSSKPLSTQASGSIRAAS